MKTWKEIISQQEEDVIKDLNKILENNPQYSINQISKNVFNMDESTIAKYLKRLGLTVIDRKVVKQPMITEIFNNINNTLTEIENETEDYKTITFKINKGLNSKLEEMLSKYRILKKQDVINVAIYDLLNGK